VIHFISFTLPHFMGILYTHKNLMPLENNCSWTQRKVLLQNQCHCVPAKDSTLCSNDGGKGKTKKLIFWDVLLYTLVEVRWYFRRAYCLHLQGQREVKQTTSKKDYVPTRHLWELQIHSIIHDHHNCNLVMTWS
jgi:hypothetical protein